MSEILMICNKSKITLCVFLFLGVAGCHKDDDPSQREIALSFLTDNSLKQWVFDKITIDGQAYIPTVCDNAYRLILKSDFTWNEFYLELQCNQPAEGQWSLNEENDVVSISYQNPVSREIEEKHFEIEELSEDYFAYQYAENNRIKYVRLRWKE